MYRRSFKTRSYRMSRKKEREDSYEDVLHAQIMQHLYGKQLNHWSEAIENLSRRNAKYHHRPDLVNHSVYYQGRIYNRKSLYAVDDPETPFVLVLHPEAPELLEEMEVIADMVDRLEQERYAVGRFVNGLLTLGVTEAQFDRILGDNVSSACSRHLLNQVLDLSGLQHEAQQESVNRYVEENQEIVDLIGERRLINLVIG